MSRRPVDVELLLRHLGINARRRGNKWVAKCPDPGHQDTDPSWSIFDDRNDRRHGSHHCLSCKFGGGPWELAAAVWGVPLKEAGARLRELMSENAGPIRLPKVVVPTPRSKTFKLPIGVVIPDTLEDFYAPALKYLHTRRVTDEQIMRWGMGYALRGRCRLRVVIPVYTSGELKTYSARAFASGIRRYDAGIEANGAKPAEAVFGEPRFDYDLGTVTIAEGCFSMLALERAGAPNPGAILSSYLTPGRILTLSRFKEIIVATDPDSAGDGVMKAISPLARRAKVRRLRLRKSPDDVPDDELRETVRDFLLT